MVVIKLWPINIPSVFFTVQACKRSPGGMEYLGNHSVSDHNGECLPWNDTSFWTNKVYFVDGTNSKDVHHNHCRFPVSINVR